MSKRLLAALAAAVCLLLGLESPAAAIIHGEPDGNRHPYAAVLWNHGLICSGAAVGSRLVVTAAHCLQEGSRFSVSFAERPRAASDGRPSPYAPGVVTGTGHYINDFCLPDCPTTAPKAATKADVAVVVLDSAVRLPRYARLPQPGLLDGQSEGRPVTDVGYGLSARNGKGMLPADAGSPTRKTFAPGLQRHGHGATHRYFLLAQRAGDMQICFGDSGGPVLLGDTLIGVNSFIFTQNCTGSAGAARVDLKPVLKAIRSYR